MARKKYTTSFDEGILELAKVISRDMAGSTKRIALGDLDVTYDVKRRQHILKLTRERRMSLNQIDRLERKNQKDTARKILVMMQVLALFVSVLFLVSTWVFPSEDFAEAPAAHTDSYKVE